MNAGLFGLGLVRATEVIHSYSSSSEMLPQEKA